MKILVAGAPKSGTTGLFYKIRNSLAGTDIRELFEPSEYLPRAAGAGRGVIAKVLIGTFYDVDFASFDGFDKKIGIIRDPRDWLISSLLFGAPAIANCSPDSRVREEATASIIALLRRKEADPPSVSVLDLIELYRRLWTTPEGVKPGRNARPFHLLPLAGGVAGHYQWRMELLSEFFHRHPDYFLVQYRDFVAGQLQPLEDYLGFSLQGEGEVDPQFKRVIRTKRSGDWRNWFLPEDVEFFRPIFTPFMEEFGYGDDWTLSQAPAVAPEHASAYVRNIIVERRADLLLSDPVETGKLIAKAGSAFKTYYSRFGPGEEMGNRGELELEIIELQVLVNLLTQQLKMAGKMSHDLESAKGRIDVLKVRLEEAREKLRQARAEHEVLRQSYSWRITRPLRSASRRLRIVRGSIPRPAPSVSRVRSKVMWKPLAIGFACILLAWGFIASHHRVIEARQGAADLQTQLTSLAIASWKYRNVFGEYPKGTSAAIARALRGENPRKIVFLDSPIQVAAADGALLDPWQKPFDIVTNGENIAITSAGPDQRFGDADDAVIKVRW